MPMIPGFVETLDKIKEIHKKKNDDYAGAFGPFFNFSFCEDISKLFNNARDKVYAVLVAVKIARLAVTLNAGTVNNESIEDSFDDLICYSTIWKSDYMDRRKSLTDVVTKQHEQVIDSQLNAADIKQLLRRETNAQTNIR